jgi:hypothetical protein
MHHGAEINCSPVLRACNTVQAFVIDITSSKSSIIKRYSEFYELNSKVLLHAANEQDHARCGYWCGSNAESLSTTAGKGGRKGGSAQVAWKAALW